MWEVVCGRRGRRGRLGSHSLRVRMKCKWPVIIAMTYICALSLRADERRAEIMRALQQRSRLVKDIHFRIPLSVWREYLRNASAPVAQPAPVGVIAQSGRYQLTLDAGGRTQLAATIRLIVFDPARCRNLPILTAAVNWTDLTVSVDGKKPRKLAAMPTVGRSSARQAIANVKTVLVRAGLIMETVLTGLCGYQSVVAPFFQRAASSPLKKGQFVHNVCHCLQASSGTLILQRTARLC